MNMENAWIRAIRLISFSLMLAFLLSPRPSFAQTRIEFTPSISVTETYDDNIDLDSTNEQSDYITSVSPAFNLSVQGENKDLTLHYSPSFVWYDKRSEDDTVRHNGSLNYDQQLSQHVKFHISDTFIKSEDPLEETEDIQAERRDRNPYWRNNGNASLQYTFGPENTFSVGYSQSRLENDDVTIDDSVTQNADADLTYWLNEKHGFETNYTYTRADFWNDGGYQAGDDYEGHGIGIKYLHRFSRHSTGFIGYTYTTRDFEGTSEDYDIHDGNIGIDHAFSENFSASASVGYFVRKNDRSGDDSGLNYDVSLSKRFERGNVTFFGRGGWNESYQDADRTGFTKYNSVGATLGYQLMQSVSANAGASYRIDEDDQADRKWNTLRGNAGLSWSFMRWLSLSLNYSYAKRDDDLDTEDYTSNRVMLTLSGSRLFRW